MIQQGALYVAYGDAARRLCARSIETLRGYAPELPVVVVSDAPVAGAELLLRPDADPGARTWKTQMYTLSPFVDTLFLDADTEVVSDPAAGFGLLRWFEVVMAQDENRRLADCVWTGHIPEERAATLAELGLDGDWLYYNTGAIFWKRTARTEALFAAWYTEWQRWRLHDQMAFARALYTHPVRLATMRETWNTRKRPRATFVWHNHHTAGREGSPQ